MGFVMAPLAGAVLGTAETASTAGTMLSLLGTGISTGLGVASSIAQGNQQAAAAEAQSKIASQNAELAEQQASAERRSGYEEMEIKRRDAARLMGQQRAAMGATGAVADVGSFEDVEATTASDAEIDAINAYNRGIDAGYNYEIQATNYRNQASAYSAQASSARNAGYLGALATGIGGIASMGSTWAKWGTDSVKAGADAGATITNSREQFSPQWDVYGYKLNDAGTEYVPFAYGVGKKVFDPARDRRHMWRGNDF